MGEYAVRRLRNWHLSTVLVEYASDNCMTITQYRGSKIPNTSSSQRHGEAWRASQFTSLNISEPDSRKQPGSSQRTRTSLNRWCARGQTGTECTPTLVMSDLRRMGRLSNVSDSGFCGTSAGSERWFRGKAVAGQAFGLSA